MSRIRLKVGDPVIVIAGDNKGKITKVKKISCIKEKYKVEVEGVTHQRCIKKTSNQPGKIINKNSLLDISNIAFFDEKNKKRSKIRFSFADNKKRCRMLKSSETIIDSKSDN